MYSLRINNAHMGIMTATAAHILIQAMVVKVGDSAVMYEDLTSLDYEDYGAPCDDTIYFYHNGTELLTWHQKVAECNENLPKQVRLRTGPHSTTLSRFKYDRKEFRSNFGSGEAASFMKRMARRSERRVSKELTRHAMSEEV